MTSPYWCHFGEFSSAFETVKKVIGKMSETIAQLEAQDVQFQAAIAANAAAIQQAIALYQSVEAQLGSALATITAASGNNTIVPASVVADFTAGYNKLSAATAALNAAFAPVVSNSGTVTNTGTDTTPPAPTVVNTGTSS